MLSETIKKIFYEKIDFFIASCIELSPSDKEFLKKSYSINVDDRISEAFSDHMNGKIHMLVRHCLYGEFEKEEVQSTAKRYHNFRYPKLSLWNAIKQALPFLEVFGFKIEYLEESFVILEEKHIKHYKGIPLPKHAREEALYRNFPEVLESISIDFDDRQMLYGIDPSFEITEKDLPKK